MSPSAQAYHQHSHCDACKIIGGGAFTLNHVIPKSALKFTQNEDLLKTYTYTGDSGNILTLTTPLSFPVLITAAR